MSEVRKSVDSETLLSTYVALYNEGLDSDGQTIATLQDVADKLGMTVNNVYQRIRTLRKELKAQGVDIPLMKRTNEPRKTVKRLSLSSLAAIASGIGKVDQS
jgi:biotin operon repressor